MAQLACCPKCGLSMQVLDLGVGPSPCPSCGGVLEEVPDAELSVPPPTPLGENWQKVRRGVRLAEIGLRLFFAAWGLFVMATVAVLVLNVADRESAANLLLVAALVGWLLIVVTTIVLSVARLRCCCVAEIPDHGKRLARISTGATLVAALAWLVPPALYWWPVTDWEWQGVALGCLAALACASLAEVTFLLYLRELGQSIPDRATQDKVRWLFRNLGLFVGLVAVLAGAFAGLLSWEVLIRPSWQFDVVVLGAGILVGLGSSVLVMGYLQTLVAARQAIDRGLAAAAAEAES